MLRSIARAALFSLVLVAGCHRPATEDPAAVVTVPGVDFDRAAVRAELATHRAAQIERLHAYAVAGEFPHNYTTAPGLHMFRDGGGRLCAVANLVHRDGRDDLVEATVRTHNDLAIADVHDGPMMEWIFASGLTQEELVSIQLPAPPLRQGAQPFAQPVGPQRVAFANPPGAMPAAQMDATVRAHVAAVEAELRARTDESLDVAVTRYMAARASS